MVTIVSTSGMKQSGLRSARVVEPEPSGLTPGARGKAVLAAPEIVTVRRYFARLTLLAQEGVGRSGAVPWEQLRVESFFDRLIEGRGEPLLVNQEERPSTAGRELVEQAFQSFAWD